MSQPQVRKSVLSLQEKERYQEQQDQDSVLSTSWGIRIADLVLSIEAIVSQPS